MLDGELVVVCRGGRLDFTALQRRITTSRAAADASASYLVFDALDSGGRDLRGYTLRVRRAVLEVFAPP